MFAFITIANQWTIHSRTFRLVQHGDSNLVALSLANLLFITLIPASAALVGAYPTAVGAADVFAVNSLLLCLSAAVVWWYVAANRHLLAEDADPRILTGIALVWALVALGFLVSIVVGLWSVYAEYALWVGWSPVVSYWWFRRRRELGA